MNHLIIGADEAVARWTFERFGLVPLKVDMAIGIVDPQQNPLGAILLHWWTGPNIYLGYYGPGTPSAGIARATCRVLVERFDVSRVTFHTHKTNRRISRWLLRQGAVFEATCRNFYGPGDNANFTAVQYAVFRPLLERLAKVPVKEMVNG